MTTEEYKQYILESRQESVTGKPVRHKYGAIATTVDDIKFDSKAEARRYQELKLLERGREIHSLTLQPRFPIEVNGEKVCTYIGDFSYVNARTGELFVEDVKSEFTAKMSYYRLKKKLVKAALGITIIEVS